MFQFLSTGCNSYQMLFVDTILKVSAISLCWLMTELAATPEDAWKRLSDLIFTPSDEVLGEVNESLSGGEDTEKASQKAFLENVNWEKYNPQIQASLKEIKYLVQSAFDRETRTINNFNLFNESIKKLNEFVIKYWLEFENEDRKMFELIAIKLIEFSKLKKSPLKALIYFLQKFFQLKINNVLNKIGLRDKKNKLDLPFIKFDQKFRKAFYENAKSPATNNIFYKIVNNMIIFANTILRLSRKYDLIDESLYFPEALDQVNPVTGEEDNLPWEDHMILSSAYIRRQAALFKALPRERLLPYKDQYVFFEEGEIKDYGNDREDLIDKVYESLGYRAIYVKKVRLEN